MKLVATLQMLLAVAISQAQQRGPSVRSVPEQILNRLIATAMAASTVQYCHRDQSQLNTELIGRPWIGQTVEIRIQHVLRKYRLLGCMYPMRRMVSRLQFQSHI